MDELMTETKVSNRLIGVLNFPPSLNVQLGW